jgi:hypothetical protein
MMTALALRILQALLLQEPATDYKGWEQFRLEAGGAKTVAMIIPTVGGRIVSYGSGENILFDNPDYRGKSLENTAPDELAQGYTGYNVDLGPELRGIPRHLGLWMGKVVVTSIPGGARLVSSHDPAVGMIVIKEIRIDAKTGALDVTQIMRNTSEKEQSYCLWDRTLCRGGGYALIPLNPKSRRPGRWSAARDGKYVPAGHTGVDVLEDVLVAKAEGPSYKLGADSDAGWIAYARGRQLLVKFFPYFPAGKYTDGGNSVELYFDPKVCELEPLSPEVSLKPGEEYAFPEKWVLIPLEREVASREEARRLVSKIPANPFRKEESPR